VDDGEMKHVAPLDAAGILVANHTLGGFDCGLDFTGLGFQTRGREAQTELGEREMTRELGKKPRGTFSDDSSTLSL
jgi:hypothetical protein